MQFKCNQCEKSYKYSRSLKKHKRTEHNVTPVRFKCTHCTKVFKLRHHLKSHEKTCSKGTSLCAHCDYVGSSYSVDKHYERDHSIKLVTENVTVGNEVEFFEWKKKLEFEDSCSFVTCRSRFIRKDGSVKMFYRCHRGGLPKPSRSKNLNNINLMRTSKIGVYCPAKLNATVHNNKCVITVCRTHVGHDCDPKMSHQSEVNIPGNDISLNPEIDLFINNIHGPQSNEENGINIINVLSKQDFGCELQMSGAVLVEQQNFRDSTGVQGEKLQETFGDVFESLGLESEKLQLTELFNNLISQAENHVEVALIRRTLRFLSSALDDIKSNIPPLLVPISR